MSAFDSSFTKLTTFRKANAKSDEFMSCRKIGNSLGVTLPKQVIDELHLKKDDELAIKKK